MRNSILSCALAISCGSFTSSNEYARTESALIDHADSVSALTEDVYVSNGNGGLITPSFQTTPLDAELYAASGADLGVTWGAWSSATASASVHCAGPNTHQRFDLQGLIPGGVYSIFYFTFGPDSQNPLCAVENSLVTVESFTADASGAARVRAEQPGCLLDATQLLYQVIYHADGQTWGALPNHGEALDCSSSFSSDAFRQVLIEQKSF